MCVYIYIYIHIYIYTHTYIHNTFYYDVLHFRDRHYQGCARTANLRTTIMCFRGFYSSRILIVRGWISHVHRGLSGNLGSSNLSRDNVQGG